MGSASSTRETPTADRHTGLDQRCSSRRDHRGRPWAMVTVPTEQERDGLQGHRPERSRRVPEGRRHARQAVERSFFSSQALDRDHCRSSSRHSRAASPRLPSPALIRYIPSTPATATISTTLTTMAQASRRVLSTPLLRRAERLVIHTHRDAIAAVAAALLLPPQRLTTADVAEIVDNHHPAGLPPAAHHRGRQRPDHESTHYETLDGGRHDAPRCARTPIPHPVRADSVAGQLRACERRLIGQPRRCQSFSSCCTRPNVTPRTIAASRRLNPSVWTKRRAACRSRPAAPRLSSSA